MVITWIIVGGIIYIAGVPIAAKLVKDNKWYDETYLAYDKAVRSLDKKDIQDHILGVGFAWPICLAWIIATSPFVGLNYLAQWAIKDRPKKIKQPKAKRKMRLPEGMGAYRVAAKQCDTCGRW